jgi:hypothetical protein
MTLVEGEKVRGSIDPAGDSATARPEWKEYRVLIEEPVELLEVRAVADDPDAELYMVADVSRAAHDPRAYRWKSEQERSVSVSVSTSAARASDLIHLADETLPIFLHVAVAAKRSSGSSRRVDFEVVAARSKESEEDARTVAELVQDDTGVAASALPTTPTQLQEGEIEKIYLPNGPGDAHVFAYHVQKPDQPVILSVSTHAGSTNFSIAASPNFDALVFGPARDVMFLPPTNSVVKKAVAMADAASKEDGERQKPCC